MTVLILMAMTTFGDLRFERVDSFPANAEEDSFYFNMPTDMATADEFLYIVDQNEHCVLKVTKKGALLKSIGRQGQGPGEFSYPSSVYVEHNRLIVYDNARKFQILSTDGKFIRSFKVLDPVFDFVVQDGVIYSLVINRVTGGFIAGHDFEGKELFKKALGFESRYDNFFQDNKAKIHLVDHQIKLLQIYNPVLHSFHKTSQKLQKSRLEFSPFADPAYLETGYKYAFQDFVVLNKQVLAFYPGRGAIKWCLFDDVGKLKARGKLPFPSEEMVSLVASILERQDSKWVLYLLTNQPEKEIRVFHLQQGAIKK